MTSQERDYLERCLASAQQTFLAQDQRAQRLSWARLLYFTLAIGILTASGLWTWATALAAAVPFVLLIHWHRRVSAQAEVARGTRDAARAAIARSDRDWANIPPLQAIPLDDIPNRAAIRDLDVYGDRSLFRLLDVGLAAVGGACVLRWLLSDPATLSEIPARQVSVSSLRARPGLLIENARLSRQGQYWRSTAKAIGAFREWCLQPAHPLSASFVWLARILTATMLVAIVTAIAFPDWRRQAVMAISFMLAAQLAVSAIGRRHLQSRLAGAADSLSALSNVIAVMRLVATEAKVDGRFGMIQQRLADERALEAVARLARLFDWDAVRYSPMTLAAANAVIGFDAHLAVAFDRWHAKNGTRVPAWIDLTGEAQALFALATLAYENPSWSMPVVHDEDAPVMDAPDCGHPLIAEPQRVANPVSLKAPGDVLIISGSNMSGKTTYLRAVGLNALLALAGGPVCATAMRVRRCRVRTSVRVEDDLSAGASLFFAEVARIREIVDAAASDGPPVLFLLDEILHGTNAADRRQATQLVLRRLIAAKAAGLITTHDPAVSDGMVDRPRHGHFTDTVTTNGAGVQMTFDYSLRAGPATTTNALRILELLGVSRTP